MDGNDFQEDLWHGGLCSKEAAAVTVESPPLYDGQHILYEGQHILYEGQHILYDGQHILYDGQHRLNQGLSV